jgi:AAA15 family ATPase/GTPase
MEQFLKGIIDLTQLRFQNFKSWRDTGQIHLAPLTGLFGPNSSGKTSLLQFLLLQKQTVEGLGRSRVLHRELAGCLWSNRQRA